MPRVPTTIAEKKAAGSYRPSTHGTDEVNLGLIGRPECPTFLNELQRQVFNEICDLLDGNGWLRVSDGETVMSYSILRSRLMTSCDDFTAADFTQLRMLANELGLSPAARAKMPKQAEKKEQNDFDDL